MIPPNTEHTNHPSEVKSHILKCFFIVKVSKQFSLIKTFLQALDKSSSINLIVM